LPFIVKYERREIKWFKKRKKSGLDALGNSQPIQIVKVTKMRRFGTSGSGEKVKGKKDSPSLH
jgi:hypothetical protein